MSEDNRAKLDHLCYLLESRQKCHTESAASVQSFKLMLNIIYKVLENEKPREKN